MLNKNQRDTWAVLNAHMTVPMPRSDVITRLLPALSRAQLVTLTRWLLYRGEHPKLLAQRWVRMLCEEPDAQVWAEAAEFKQAMVLRLSDVLKDEELAELIVDCMTEHWEV